MLAWVCYFGLSLVPVPLHCPHLMMSVGTVEGHLPLDPVNGFDYSVGTPVYAAYSHVQSDQGNVFPVLGVKGLVAGR